MKAWQEAHEGVCVFSVLYIFKLISEWVLQFDRLPQPSEYASEIKVDGIDLLNDNLNYFATTTGNFLTTSTEEIKHKIAEMDIDQYTNWYTKPVSVRSYTNTYYPTTWQNDVIIDLLIPTFSEINHANDSDQLSFFGKFRNKGFIELSERYDEPAYTHDIIPTTQPIMHHETTPNDAMVTAPLMMHHETSTSTVVTSEATMFFEPSASGIINEKNNSWNNY